MNGCVAVFDIGKTNIKLVVFDAAGNVAAERGRAQRTARAGCAHGRIGGFDTEGAWAFLIGALKELGAQFFHRGDLDLGAWRGGRARRGRRRRAAAPSTMSSTSTATSRPNTTSFAPPFEETLSPNLPRGLNLGRQVFYLQRRFPAEFAAARAFLAYPQYWSWRLERRRRRPSSPRIGSHTDLWRPIEGRLSSMVDKLGWRRLFPPMRKAWDTLGTLKPEVAAATGLAPNVRVVCGAHDSNASLVPASHVEARAVHRDLDRNLGHHHGGRGKGRLDPKADMLANVDVRGVAGADRALHGRARVRGPCRRRRRPTRTKPTSRPSSPRASLALPAFSDQGGPFAARKGGIEGEAPATPKARAALATLYAALMTAHLLQRLEAPGDLIVEGGFTRSPAFAAVLARLMAAGGS